VIGSRGLSVEDGAREQTHCREIPAPLFRVLPLVRAYLLAFGLTTILIGLFLLFAGYVHIGCTVGGTSSNPTFSNCSGANDLEFGGAVLTIAAILMFIGAMVPDSTSRYK
jgi:hypothetical protein